MIRVPKDCDQCSHKTTCWKFGQLSTYRNALRKAPYKDYDFETLSDHYGFAVDISCKDFEQRVPRPRKAFS